MGLQWWCLCALHASPVRDPSIAVCGHAAGMLRIDCSDRCRVRACRTSAGVVCEHMARSEAAAAAAGQPDTLQRLLEWAGAHQPSLQASLYLAPGHSLRPLVSRLCVCTLSRFIALTVPPGRALKGTPCCVGSQSFVLRQHKVYGQ